MDRRTFILRAMGLTIAPSLPETYAIAAGEALGGERFGAPLWSPAAGQIKTISYAAGKHPFGRGATLSEISPVYYDWNPDKPNLGVFGIKNIKTGKWAYSWGSILSYCGSSFNSATRQIVTYQAGHSAANVCAPFCFDLNDLRWKWLDTPVPFDGYAAVYFGSKAIDSVSMAALYSDQLDYEWGEVNGGSSAFGVYARPGVIQPIPGHSRAGLVYIPPTVAGNAKGKMHTCVQATGVLSGVLSKQSHVFDYDTAHWSRTTDLFPLQSGLGHSRSACLDSESGKIVVMGNCSPRTPLFIFDVASGSYARRYPGNSVDSCTDVGGSIYHEASGLHVFAPSRTTSGAAARGLDGVTMQFIACPMDSLVGSGVFSFTTLNVAVESTWPLNSYGYNISIGWTYCPVDKCLYAINGVGGSNKYWRLSPPPNATMTGDYLSGTWTLSALTFTSGQNASSVARSNIYQKLSWDKESRSFVFFSDSINDPVQAFRPAGI